jgi:single-stranded-DNA-specific exonuclease
MSPSSPQAPVPALSLLGKTWTQRAAPTLPSLALAQRLNLDPLVASILTTRGIGPDEAPAFLEPKLRDAMPDPFVLKDMDVVVRRLEKALRTGEHVMIFADYDVDGATSSALLSQVLKSLGANVDVYIPDRLKEGYGPNVPAMEAFHAQGVDLIITLDCGTNAFAPLLRAKELGMDVIVIDHHEAEPLLPEAVGIINPNRLDMEKSDLCHLAAVGVCFITLVALFSHLRIEGFARPLPSLLNWLDLVALGTVCDVMRLQGLNRAFVAQGLKVMAARQNVGLCALMDVGGLREKPSAYHLGFVLGPRINAGGRVGEANLGTRLLTTQDPATAKTLALRLDQLNKERQALEEEALADALTQAYTQSDKRCLVVASPHWHPGIIGIVAGRLKEQFHKPVFALSFWSSPEDGKGSGRSVPGICLGSLVHAAKQKGLILGGGGHAMAAGLSLTEAQLAPFQAFLEERLVALGDEQIPTLTYDGFLPLEGAHLSLLETLALLEPYGQGNPSPRFVITDVFVKKAFPMGQNHLKCTLVNQHGKELEGVAFRCLDTALGVQLLKGTEPYHLLGSLKKNTWQGQEKPQFIIEDAVSARYGNWVKEPLVQDLAS